MNNKYNLNLDVIPDMELESISFFYAPYVYIYCLQNKRNGKRYIGRSINPKKRYCTHISLIKTRKHQSITDYEDDYDFTILDKVSCMCEINMEFEYQEKFKSYDERYGYNNNDRHWKAVKKNDSCTGK